MRGATLAATLAVLMLAGLTASGQVDIRGVQIQVWISQTSETGLRDLGTNLTYTRTEPRQDGAVRQISTNVFNPATIQSGLGLEFDIIDELSGRIDGVFRGLERNNDFDLIAKPELLVNNGVTAEIRAGSQVPYQDVVSTDKGQTVLKVDWEPTGVNLRITPTIQPDNLIRLDIAELNVIDTEAPRTVRGIDLPVFSNRSQSGSVLVPNGQTLVIGGLSTRTVRRSEQRVPIVGRIPLLGIGFRGRKTDAANTHLLVFVSPTVVDLRALKPQGQRALEFWREERWKYRDRIDQEIRALEQEL